jgi:putative transposase
MPCELAFGSRLVKLPSPPPPSSIARASKPPSKADQKASTREKKINGRKRHVVVDTLGLLWALVVTPASVQDAEGAKLALTVFRSQVKFPKIIWADAAYRAVLTWAWVQWLWNLVIVSAKPGQKGFQVQPKRWIVERTFGWLNRSRRLSKDYEHTIQSSQAFIQLAMIHLMIRRLRKTPT